MRQTNHAKFALTALVICANAHCGEDKLSVDRLAALLRGKARPGKHEKAALEQIRDNADPQLVEQAKSEAQQMDEWVVVSQVKPKPQPRARKEKSIARG